MRQEIIIQGHVVGYIEKDSQRALLTQEAPSSILDELLETGYAVCLIKSSQHNCVGFPACQTMGA